MPPDFRLLETMRVSDGSVFLLARHLERLSASARHFDFACDIDTIRAVVLGAAIRQTEPRMARLLLSRSGKHELQFRAMPHENPMTLRISPVIVSSSNTMLYHKTTARNIYERAREGAPNGTDALLHNERGEVTETTIANVAVKRGDVWITPAVFCGLLPGTMRAQLLDDGGIQEGVVRLEELTPGEPIRCFNAVRGIWDAQLVL